MNPTYLAAALVLACATAPPAPTPAPPGPEFLPVILAADGWGVDYAYSAAGNALVMFGEQLIGEQTIGKHKIPQHPPGVECPEAPPVVGGDLGDPRRQMPACQERLKHALELQASAGRGEHGSAKAGRIVWINGDCLDACLECHASCIDQWCLDKGPCPDPDAQEKCGVSCRWGRDTGVN